MSGLTRMLVQLCTAEELAYMTLPDKYNYLNAEAFNCCCLLTGLAGRQVKSSNRSWY